MLKTNLLFVFITSIIASDHIILSSRIPKERIMDGDVASIEEFPFIVHLEIETETHLSGCGGSLIGPSTVLTAAHCLVGTNNDTSDLLKNIKIRAGSDNNADGGIVAYAIHYLKHPKYFPRPDYDIAIIQLDRPVILQGLKTAIIEMWDEDVQFEPNTPCWIAGWGRHTPNDLINKYQLEKKEIFLIDSHECPNERRICASHPSWGWGGVSHGDSGGPLIIDGKLAGIAEARTPDKIINIFTSVPAFRNWIRENSGI